MKTYFSELSVNVGNYVVVMVVLLLLLIITFTINCLFFHMTQLTYNFDHIINLAELVLA